MGRSNNIGGMHRLRTSAALIRRVVVPLLAVFLAGYVSAQPQANASLQGTLRDARGNPVAGTIISLELADHSKTFSIRTDADGKYRFSVPSGTYILSAVLLHSQARLTPILVGPKESKIADLALVDESARQQTICDTRLTSALHTHPEDCTRAVPAGLASMDKQPDSSLLEPQFSDEPEFAVAGVKDTTNLGGHGSEAIVRARNNLAKETVSLGKPSGIGGPANAGETASSLREELNREPNNAELHHRLAELEEQLGNPLEAVHHYQRAAEINPTEPYLFDWGAELLLHHAPEPAIEVFTKGSGRFPKSARMLLGLGAAQFALGASDRAMQKIYQASDLDPGDPGPYLFLGKMLHAQTRAPSEAVERLHRFVSLQPQNADANYYYAIALWKQPRNPSDKTSDAEVEYLLNRSVQLDPGFAPAHLQLGIIYSERHDNPHAISALEQAVQADPQSNEAHYRLSQIYRQLGESAKAKREMEIYQQLSKESELQTDRERHEIRQFVYTLRDRPAAESR